MKKVLQALIPNLKFALLAIFFYHLLYINTEIYADYWDEKSFLLSGREDWWLIKKQYWIDWSDYDQYGSHNILYFLPYTHSMGWGEFVFYVFIGLIFFVYVIFPLVLWGKRTHLVYNIIVDVLFFSFHAYLFIPQLIDYPKAGAIQDWLFCPIFFFTLLFFRIRQYTKQFANEPMSQLTN